MRRILNLNSSVETVGYEDLMDFYMSERFGMDWPEYGAQRVQTFMSILTLEAEGRKEAGKKKR